MLHADVHLRRGEFALRITLSARPETPLVIVGESGAGKTTFLEMLAGTIRPDSGRITFDDAVWFDSESKGASLPTYQRPIGYVAQTPTLFPHMNVRHNVAFGLRASGVDVRTALGRADEALREVGLDELGNRKPDHLSGGQRQRVTLARALCLEPKLLLLDEPLSSLDVGARQAMRAEIRSALKKLRCVAVYVTHDPLEALSFGDEIAVIEDGCVSQVGNKVSLLREPRSQYVGRFVGINLFRGTVHTGGNENVTAVKVRDAMLEVVDVEGPGEVFVAISPQDITLSKEAPSGSARNVFQGRVEEIVPSLPLGERMRVQLKTNPPLVAEITKHAAEAMALQPGTQVYAAVKATAIRTYR